MTLYGQMTDSNRSAALGQLGIEFVNRRGNLRSCQPAPATPSKSHQLHAIQQTGTINVFNLDLIHTRGRQYSHHSHQHGSRSPAPSARPEVEVATAGLETSHRHHAGAHNGVLRQTSIEYIHRRRSAPPTIPEEASPTNMVRSYYVIAKDAGLVGRKSSPSPSARSRSPSLEDEFGVPVRQRSRSPETGLVFRRRSWGTSSGRDKCSGRDSTVRKNIAEAVQAALTTAAQAQAQAQAQIDDASQAKASQQPDGEQNTEGTTALESSSDFQLCVDPVADTSESTIAAQDAGFIQDLSEDGLLDTRSPTPPLATLGIARGMVKSESQVTTDVGGNPCLSRSASTRSFVLSSPISSLAECEASINVRLHMLCSAQRQEQQALQRDRHMKEKRTQLMVKELQTEARKRALAGCAPSTPLPTPVQRRLARYNTGGYAMR